MKRILGFCLIVALLLITAHRLPAPISEDSPTPAPEQSAKAKPRRTVKPKASENSESSTKAKTSSPTPNRNPFDGTWVGKGEIARWGVIEQIVVSGSGNSVDVKLAGQDVLTGQDLWYRNMKPAYEGGTLILNNGDGRWALTPNSEGKTAHFTCDWPGFLLAPRVHSSATFKKASP
jgi:hypothetical protein